MAQLASREERPWWRDAVTYQIYPRSFADSNGDGIGDVEGIRSRLPYLKSLGIDAIWISPWYPSPQHDHGYDVADYMDIEPAYGTLAQAEQLIKEAHDFGIKLIVDIVPNHTSSDHKWFQEALAAKPGSKERDRYMFRDGKGENGDLPPNNWEAVFGGPAWHRITEADGTPGQWYLHLFAVEQPDLNWENQEVKDHLEDVLKFWLDRGVDGFRIDVAHGMIKEAGLPDGVFNVLNGDKESVDGLLHSPDVESISFVGSTPIARYIYEECAKAGKRVQSLGGAKNHMLVLPDADLELVADSAINAGFGSAGERCMAISVVVAVEPVNNNGPLT